MHGQVLTLMGSPAPISMHNNLSAAEASTVFRVWRKLAESGGHGSSHPPSSPSMTRLGGWRPLRLGHWATNFSSKRDFNQHEPPGIACGEAISVCSCLLETHLTWDSFQGLKAILARRDEMPAPTASICEGTGVRGESMETKVLAAKNRVSWQGEEWSQGGVFGQGSGGGVGVPEQSVRLGPRNVHPDIYSPRSRGWKSKAEVSQGWFSLRSRSLTLPASPQSCTCMSVSRSPLIRTPVLWD